MLTGSVSDVCGFRVRERKRTKWFRERGGGGCEGTATKSFPANCATTNRDIAASCFSLLTMLGSIVLAPSARMAAPTTVVAVATAAVAGTMALLWRRHLKSTPEKDRWVHPVDLGGSVMFGSALLRTVSLFRAHTLTHSLSHTFAHAHV